MPGHHMLLGIQPLAGGSFTFQPPGRRCLGTGQRKGPCL